MTKIISKSIKDIAWNVSEDEYRQSDAISYSTLSKFNKEGFKKIPSLFERVDSPALRMGSLVDCILTSPEELDEKFYFTDVKRPSETISKMVEALKDSLGGEYSELEQMPKKALIEVLNRFNYYSNYSDPKRILLLLKGGSDYYKFLLESEGKTIVDLEEYEKAKLNANTLKTHPYTNRFFIINKFKKEIENIDQLKFKIPYKNTGVRCMFDKIIVDHKNKTILPCDIKTTGYDEGDFEHSFTEWGYYIQATLYTYILKKVISLDEYFKDFTILPYQFIIINKFSNIPLVWEFELNHWEGDFSDADGIIYRGWMSLYDELIYYLDKAEFIYSKEAIENNGVLKISKLIKKEL